MSAVTIPLRNDLPVYDFSVELDGQTYGLEFRWNFRSEQWAFSISDALGVVIVANVAIVVDFPLARRIQDQRMPPGVFIAKDTAGGHLDPAFADLGVRVQLLYFSKAELLPPAPIGEAFTPTDGRLGVFSPNEFV